MIKVARPADLVEHIGKEAVAVDTVLIDQTLIDGFIALSGDDQQIHRGPNAIAPGNLILALTPRLLKCAVRVERFDSAVTARYERVAFRRPARTGDRLGLRARIERVAAFRGAEQARVAVTIYCRLSAAEEIASLYVTDVYRDEAAQ